MSHERRERKTGGWDKKEGEDAADYRPVLFVEKRSKNKLLKTQDETPKPAEKGPC